MSQDKRVSFQNSSSLSLDMDKSYATATGSQRPKKHNFLVTGLKTKGRADNVQHRQQMPAESLGNPNYPSYEKKYFQNMLSRMQRTSGLRDSKVKKISTDKLMQVIVTESVSQSGTRPRYFPLLLCL